MSATYRNQAQCLNKMINANNETQAQLYLKQLLLFPVDVQDKIIEEISHLTNCDNDAIASVIAHYAITELR